jgi:hypothetical protein
MIPLHRWHFIEASFKLLNPEMIFAKREGEVNGVNPVFWGKEDCIYVVDTESYFPS